MAKAKAIVFTEFRYLDEKVVPINLIFVLKNFDTISFTDRIYNLTFDNLKGYTDFILDIARNNSFLVGYASRFDCKFYDIMFRNVDYDYEYDRFAYWEKR